MSNTTVTVNTVEFAKAFCKATKGTVPKSSIECLKRVFLSVEGNSLIVRSSTLETWFSAEVKALQITGDTEEVKNVSIKPESLTKALKFFPKADTMLTFDVKNKEVTIESGSKRIQLSFLFDDNFPIAPKVYDAEPTYTMNVVGVAKRMSKIKYAVAKTDVKPILTGIHFNKADMVAIDGYRMALSKGTDEVAKPFTIPVDALAYACECMEDMHDSHKVQITQNNKYISFSSADNVRVVARLIEGIFYDYQRIIPQNADNHCTIDREKMAETLKYLKLFISDATSQPVVYCGDTLRVKTDDGTFEERLGVAAPLADPIGFNIKYMQEAFGQFAKGTKIDFAIGNRAIDAIVLTHEDDLALVLPIRLSDNHI